MSFFFSPFFFFFQRGKGIVDVGKDISISVNNRVMLCAWLVFAGATRLDQEGVVDHRKMYQPKKLNETIRNGETINRVYVV